MGHLPLREQMGHLLLRENLLGLLERCGRFGERRRGLEVKLGREDLRVALLRILEHHLALQVVLEVVVRIR